MLQNKSSGRVKETNVNINPLIKSGKKRKDNEHRSRKRREKSAKSAKPSNTKPSNTKPSTSRTSHTKPSTSHTGNTNQRQRKQHRTRPVSSVRYQSYDDLDEDDKEMFEILANPRKRKSEELLPRRSKRLRKV